jgi:hypothetical protein
LRDEFAGKQAKCKCGQVLHVPEPSAIDSLFDQELPATEAAPLPRRPPAGGPLPSAAPKKSGPNLLLIAGIAGAGVFVLVVVGLLVVLGTGSNEGGSAEQEELRGYASPEEAFAAQKKATMEKDYKTLIEAMTPEAQEAAVGGIVVAAAMMAPSSPELAKLLDDHGIDESMREMPALSGNPQDMQESLAAMKKMQEKQKALVAGMEDKVGFFVAAMGHVEAFGDRFAEKLGQTGGQFAELKADAERAQAEAELVDLQIDGDRAQGKQRATFRGRTMNVPMWFRRIDGRWYLDQPDLTAQPGQASPMPGPPVKPGAAAPSE